MDRTISTSTIDDKLLAHRIIYVDQWMQEIIDGGIANLRRETIALETKSRMEDSSVATMPADADTMLNEIFDADGYKTAAEITDFDDSVPR